MAKFKKGDKVKIKTWVEMASQYGLANNGLSISCRASFTDAMEANVNNTCKSRVCVVSEAKYDKYKLKTLDGEKVLSGYIIRDDMLKPFGNKVDKDTYDKWIMEQYTRYTAEEKSLCVYIIHSGKNGIIITEPRTGRSGCSYCHTDDKWDRKTGIAIAYARLKGEEVLTLEEEEEKNIADLKNGDKFKFSGKSGVMEFIGYCKATDSYVVYAQNGTTKHISKNCKDCNVVLV